MNYNNFINNLHVGDIFLCMGQELTVRKADRKTKIVELGHSGMSTMMSFDRLYDKYKCKVFHPYTPVKDIDPSDYYDTDLWFEVEDNKNLHICENCDDYAVCDFGDHFDTPCSQFEWRTDKLHKFVKERIEND